MMTESLQKALIKLAAAPHEEQKRILTLVLAELKETESSPEAKPKGEGLLAKLLEIKIEAPADLSENFDQYASGEKRIENAVC